MGKAFADRWPEVLLVTAALVAVGYLGHGSCWGVHPSDRSMIANFREHQAKFQALADAALEQGPGQPVKRGVPGVQDIYAVTGGVVFVASVDGAMLHGSIKGYVYSPGVPGNMTGEPSGEVYRKIEGDWYVFVWD